MLIRYKQDEHGKTVPVANIYTQKEHKINYALLDKDAVWAIKKLQQSGAEAYLVGGAVRDLMLGQVPKDFDIATSASPRQIQRLFWNARIIGKRFKLVHLVFKDKVHEVSTFRSGEEAMEGNNNVFGSIDQDAKRRDFSINSFYYDPSTNQLLDFNNAMDDFRKKRISSIIALDESFTEDPVRMIRAVKYSIITGFTLRLNVRMAIRKYSNELSRTSTSRLTEEVNKILASGHSREIFNELQKYKLLVFMLPCFSIYSKFPQVQDSLRDLDARVMLAKENKGPAVMLADMIKALVDPLIVFADDQMTSEERFKETFRQIKVLISPMTPSNYEVELASERLLSARGFKTPRNCVRNQRPSNKPPQRRGPSRPKRSEGTGEVSAASRKRRSRGRSQKRPVEQEQKVGSSAEAHDL
ncbi:MAG: poly(A) polymerase [Sphaerochaeta sp.]|nr:poly(A) polymerase [Sphaerochaeta sp.]